MEEIAPIAKLYVQGLALEMSTKIAPNASPMPAG